MTLRDLAGRDRIIGSRSVKEWGLVTRLPGILGDLVESVDPGYNSDNILRFTLASAETSIKVWASTTSNYYKLRYGETESSVYPDVQGGYYYATTYNYTNPILDSLPTGVAKVIELISCDVSGNPSGEIMAASLYQNDTDVTEVDASGCTSLTSLHLSSSTGYPGWFVGQSSQPSSITKVRAVGVDINNGYFSTSFSYSQVGLSVSGQQMDAAALDQLYSDLSAGVGFLFVGGNPGTSGDDPTIATGKGYTVIGS